MMRLKLTIAAIVLFGAVAYLAVAGIRSGWVYYMAVDEFLAEAHFHDQRIRLHGVAGTENFDTSHGLLSVSFELLGETGRIPVVYQGVIPDLFEPGKEVVVEGQFDEARVFQANVLMTKCASKYEPASPHAEVAATSVSQY